MELKVDGKEEGERERERDEVESIKGVTEI
jgi:hypothetical protein